MVKKLPYSDYVYLLKNCHASLCFIDGYSTWNLAVQDCLVSGIPSLFLEHPTIRKVVGENYSGGFKNFDEFLCLLEVNKADDFDNCQVIYEHDFVYELQLKGSSSHLEATEKFQAQVTEMMKNLSDSTEDTKRYKVFLN